MDRGLEGAVSVAEEGKKGFRGVVCRADEVLFVIAVDVYGLADGGSLGGKDKGRLFEVCAAGLAEQNVENVGMHEEVAVDDVGQAVSIEVGDTHTHGVVRGRESAGVAEGLGAEWSGGDEGEEAESKQAIQEKGSGAVCSGACADDIAGVVWDEDRICNRIVVGRDAQADGFGMQLGGRKR